MATIRTITGGLLCDGTGSQPRPADVRTVDDRIVSVESPGLRPPEGEIVDATACWVTPGFIDIHAHGDIEPLVVSGADSKLLNGVTTELCGNCGSTPFPLGDYIPGYLREKAELLGVDIDWNSTAEYFDRCDAAGCAINRAFLVGHGRIRSMVLSGEGRPAASDEIAEMRRHVEAALDDGAWGMSTGLAYPVGCYAESDEIRELCRTVCGEGALHASHIRNEDENVLEALEEVLDVARSSGVRTHIAHIKISGIANWKKVDRLRRLIEDARADELCIDADWYPYTAWNANLDSLLPKWVSVGGTARLLDRLRDPKLRAQLAENIDDFCQEGLPWDCIIVGSTSLPENRHFQGHPIDELAREVGISPRDFLFNLILAEGGRAEGIVFTMCEVTQARLVALPFVSIGSDGTAREFTGPTADGFPHPRSYGSHARALRYARDGMLPFDMAETVRRMTSLPADQIGLADRGRITPGAVADITIFDPEEITDLATYNCSVQPSVGVRHVLVDGVPVVREGKPTGARPGKVLRRSYSWM